MANLSMAVRHQKYFDENGNSLNDSGGDVLVFLLSNASEGRANREYLRGQMSFLHFGEDWGVFIHFKLQA